LGGGKTKKGGTAAEIAKGGRGFFHHRNASIPGRKKRKQSELQVEGGGKGDIYIRGKGLPILGQINADRRKKPLVRERERGKI